MKVLVLGASGLLGNAMFRVLSERAELDVRGTLRFDGAQALFTPALAAKLESAGDLEDHDRLTRLIERLRPEVVVNCIAVDKASFGNRDRAIAVFALLPQRLSRICARNRVRLVQIGSDGVFSGARGMYTEADVPDADDAYGVAKTLGEIREPHAITIRTSMIGRSLGNKGGLLEWFLSQTERCRCYTKAIFSGFPTVVLAQIVRDVVLQRPDLSGVYHVASEPISKYDLLTLVADAYGKRIAIEPDDTVAIDRSLVAARFEAATGYKPAAWPELIDIMKNHRFGLVGE